MSSATVPIFAPDGTLGDIPYERLHEAIAAGAKMGVNITDPDGNPGVIPADRTQDAVKAGAKVIPYDVAGNQPQDQPGFFKNMAQQLTASYQKVPGESIEQSVAGAITGEKGQQLTQQQTEQNVATGNVRGLAGQLAASELPAVMGAVQLSGIPAAVSEKVSSLIPSTQRAGQVLQGLKTGATGAIPIDVSAPGSTALEIDRLAGAGGTLPKVIRNFISRTTDPNQAPLTFAEARDFYQNASRLSVNEFNNLTPNAQRLVGQFVRKLGDSLQEAANTAGKGGEYASALHEYHAGKQLGAFQDRMKQAAADYAASLVKGAGLGTGGGAAYYAYRKLFGDNR